ncbi:MAG: hypothetical protein ACQESP_07010 [Candidatus Muiribacteriota bacterium]
MENIFTIENEEVTKMVTRNQEFLNEIVKSSVKHTQDFVKGNMKNYFTNLEKVVSLSQDNFEKSFKHGSEITVMAKENMEKTNKVLKEVFSANQA